MFDHHLELSFISHIWTIAWDSDSNSCGSFIVWEENSSVLLWGGKHIVFKSLMNCGCIIHLQNMNQELFWTTDILEGREKGLLCLDSLTQVGDSFILHLRSVEDLRSFELCLIKMCQTCTFSPPGGEYIRGTESVLKGTSGDYLPSMQVQTEEV